MALDLVQFAGVIFLELPFSSIFSAGDEPDLNVVGEVKSIFSVSGVLPRPERYSKRPPKCLCQPCPISVNLPTSVYFLASLLFAAGGVGGPGRFVVGGTGTTAPNDQAAEIACVGIAAFLREVMMNVGRRPRFGRRARPDSSVVLERYVLDTKGISTVAGRWQ